MLNYPTSILHGTSALDELAGQLGGRRHRLLLVVSDPQLVRLGVVRQVLDALRPAGMRLEVFDGLRPNPVEEDVERGVAAYRQVGADGIVAVGGGSPLDVAKTIKFAVCHAPPLAQYDDALDGGRLIVSPMPPLYAVPTTAGTGSEVGRSSVIIMRASGRKTVFFHPRLMPDIAVLAPQLTAGLPPSITAATGIDALTHCVESFLCPAVHPLADGIALEGLRLVLEQLPRACARGQDLEARMGMQFAATMGATAFQKGLGMTHSLAHPLSAVHDLHHGLANALLLPRVLAFLERVLNERAAATGAQRDRLARLHEGFRAAGQRERTLSEAAAAFFASVGIAPGLRAHGIRGEDLESLSRLAYEDPCHQGNLVPVHQGDLLSVYREAL